MTTTPSLPTLRQQHEREVYDARAAELDSAITDDELRVDASSPPYPNREHVRFLDFMFAQAGELAGKRVLEVGCGTGNLSTYMALRGARTVGVDVSAGMLELARRRARVNGVADRTTFLVQPVEDLDEPDGSFDVVIANQVLHHLDLPRAMPNIARLLSQDGCALFAEPVLLLPEWVRTARYSTPVLRVFPARTDTPDERSIDLRDLDLIRSAFAQSSVHPFQAFARLQNFVDLSDPAFHRLQRFDEALLTRVSGSRRLARYVVLVLRGRAAATAQVGAS